MNFVLKTASAQEIAALNASKISPLCRALLRCASTNTKKGCKSRALSLCCNVVQTCIDRGLDLNLGMPTAGMRWALPIVIAARFSMLPVLQLLLDAGVRPEVADSEGLTPFHCAFSNPSSGTGSTLRAVDIECVQLFLQRNLVMANLSEWKLSIPGSCFYIGVEDLARQTVLYGCIVHKNYQTAAIIVNQGGRLSNNNFLMLFADRKSKRELTRLLPIVEYVAAVQNRRLFNGAVVDRNAANRYDKSISWSFPPNWTDGMFQVLLCWQSIGLPQDVLMSVLVPLLSRSHFFNATSRKTLVPNLARLRPNFAAAAE